LATLFVVFDGGMKAIMPALVVKVTVWHAGVAVGLGITLLVSTALYAIPHTMVLGVILITAYLGAPVATNRFLKEPMLYIVLAVVYRVLLWGGLFLRDAQLRAILPMRR
jgi:hypothetical protein